jgi:hypothetical protein
MPEEDYLVKLIEEYGDKIRLADLHDIYMTAHSSVFNEKPEFFKKNPSELEKQVYEEAKKKIDEKLKTK